MPVDKLSLLKRSKEYMESLAAGVDPVSGQTLSREDPMGSERMRRCFAFVASVLEEVIGQRENGGEPRDSGRRRNIPADPESDEAQSAPKKRKRAEKALFAIDEEQLDALAVTETPANLTELARRLNAAAGLEKSDLTSPLLGDGLEAMGFLETKEGQDGKRHRLPTDAGLGIGIDRLRCVNSAGQPYQVNVLDAQAQRFLLDNLEAVLAAGRKIRSEAAAEKARKRAEELIEKARRIAQE